VLLGLALVIIGYCTEDVAVQLVGYSFLFICGTALLSSNVTFNSGFSAVETFDYETNSTLVIQTNTFSNISDTYSHVFGVWLSIASILGFAFSLAYLKNGLKWRKEMNR
jgi:hypothetical protein